MLAFQFGVKRFLSFQFFSELQVVCVGESALVLFQVDGFKKLIGCGQPCPQLFNFGSHRQLGILMRLQEKNSKYAKISAYRNNNEYKYMLTQQVITKKK